MCLIIFTNNDTQKLNNATHDAGIHKGAIITIDPTPRNMQGAAPLLAAVLPRALNIVNPPDGLDTHNAAVWLWDGVKISRRT